MFTDILLATLTPHFLELPHENVFLIFDSFDNIFGIENDFYKMFEGEMLVMSLLLMHQIFLFFLTMLLPKDFSKLVRLLLVAVSMNGLRVHQTVQKYQHAL